METTMPYSLVTVTASDNDKDEVTANKLEGLVVTSHTNNSQDEVHCSPQHWCAAAQGSVSSAAFFPENFKESHVEITEVFEEVVLLTSLQSGLFHLINVFFIEMLRNYIYIW